ncbi:putative amino acid transporter protein [Neofusicoccum parvum UCRNP2]|uniref:Putative amino acid transporter protein n=1 Tax=Botryosphaeria parva (strain UCR-NP2) TaxID=1287680 RepID=R1H1V9_BOTPV|nr:putative amino acid transporter protein [Neofusicoccum parvum UCRNP2]
MSSLTKTRTADSTAKPAINGTAADVELQSGSASPVAGHAEELRRDFSVWSLGALLVCLMGTWEALSSVVAQALTNGGAPCLFYNYVLAFIGTLLTACSLAEIASVYPTAGGQYHWVASLAPSHTRLVASWFTGWINIGGQIVLTASAAFAAGLQFQALIVLNDASETYVPQRWQGMLFYWLIIVYSTIVNIFGVRVLPHTNTVSGIVHVVGFVATVIVLGVMGVGQQGGHTADYDAAAHLAEELPNPSRSVPLAMIGSIVVNGLMGLIYCIVMLFALGDLTSLLSSPTGFPFMQLFQNVTGNRAGATILSLFISLIAVAANAAGTTSTSRTAWAFARDRAVPFSSYFAHVDERWEVPVRMVVCTSLLQALLGFIYLGNTTAFNAILSMAILGMYASYILPIAYMLAYGRRPDSPIRAPGPFSLGAWGPWVNAAAVAWLAVAMVFSTFPSVQPVSPQNMNYASVVLGGWVAFGVVYYVGFARRWYEGPVVEVFG